MKQEGDLLKTVTEEVRENIRKYLEETTGWAVSNRRIKALVVYPRPSRHKIYGVTIEIGKYLDNRMSDTPNEEVMAIFESNAFLVCTQNRGVLRGMPYLYGKEEVQNVKEIE
jgi:hypothetical protein